MREYGRLAGKRSLVTGAGSGIGRAIAVAFAAEGAAVLCVDIDEESAKETVSLITAKQESAFAACCDVSNSASVQQLFQSVNQSLQGLDVLVNNAAFFATRMSVGRLDEALWGPNHGSEPDGLLSHESLCDPGHDARRRGKHHPCSFRPRAYRQPWPGCVLRFQGWASDALKGYCCRPCKGRNPQ